jgi:hypothetical protein
MNDASETIVDVVEKAAENVGPKAFAAGFIAAVGLYGTYRINRRFVERREAKKLTKAQNPIETTAQ